MHECETDTEHDEAYSTLANLREIAVFQNLEVAEQCAHLQRLLVPFFDIWKVEEDVICVCRSVKSCIPQQRSCLPLIDALRNQADCGTYAHTPSTTHSSWGTSTPANCAMMSGGDRGQNS